MISWNIYVHVSSMYENTNWSSQYKRATTQLVHLKSQLNVWEYPCAQMSSWTWSVSDSTYIWQRQTIKSGKVKIKPPGPKNWQNYRFRVTNGKNWTEGCDCDNTLQLFCVCLLMKSYWILLKWVDICKDSRNFNFDLHSNWTLIWHLLVEGTNLLFRCFAGWLDKICSCNKKFVLPQFFRGPWFVINSGLIQISAKTDRWECLIIPDGCMYNCEKGYIYRNLKGLPSSRVKGKDGGVRGSGR